MRPRGLPGLRLERAAPPADRVLPRMDVAGFVGFAAAGPLDVPVPIENTGQFVAIFGADLRVTTGRGETRRGFLGAAVRAFFAGGGRRCWVVRVAGPEASAASFELATLVARDGAPARLVARSPGSWADDLSVAATFRRRGVRAPWRTYSVDDGATLRVCLVVDVVGAPVRGDTLVWETTAARYCAAVVASAADGARLRLTTGLVARVAPGGARPTVAGHDDVELPTAGYEVWSLDLHVRARGGSLPGVTDLGLHPLHPRYWRRLPDDVALFTGAADPGLAREVASPRLAIAGVAAPPGADESAGEVPLGPVSSAWRWAAPQLTGPAWQRDGMTKFDPMCLLDPRLAAVGLAALPALADDLRFLRGAPQRLTGVHALLAVDEVTLVALPDLAQPAWEIAEAAAPGPSFTEGPGPGEFVPDGASDLGAPRWADLRPIGDRWDVAWSEVPGATLYRLERASDPGFGDAEPIAHTCGRDVVLDLARAGATCLRVRAETDERAGPWSRTCTIVAADGPALRASECRPDPAIVQRAVLRLCAARGDLLAVLVAPDGEHADAVAHATRLCARLDPAPDLVAPLAWDERRALGHAALFAPWTWVRDEDGELRAVPPDGAIVGLLARRSVEAGAWLSVANLPLAGALAVRRATSDDQALALLAARVQPLRREPWGLVALEAATLADGDDEVVHLHTRRLLALLRRLALLRGQDWVFEPMGASTERGVKAGMEALLRQLFVRGAFAGDRPEDAYSVRVQPDADRGRCVVELRVAPAEPLRFVTVRLVQDDVRGLAVEGG